MKNLLRYLLSIALAFAFLSWAFRGTETAALLSAVTAVPLHWVMVLVPLILVSLMIRSWRWIVLMRPFANHVTIWQALKAVLICYAANVVVPRSGEALRALSIRWASGASVTSVLATVVVERIVDIVWLLLLVGASLAFIPAAIATSYSWFESIFVGAIVGCAVMLMGLTWLAMRRDTAPAIAHRILSGISTRLADTVVNLLAKFAVGLESLKTPSAYFQLTISSALINISYVLIVYLSFLAFGFDASPHNLGITAALVVMTMSSIGMVVPTPGGIGSYHLLFAQTLHIVYGIPQVEALACATFVHSIATATYLALGVPALASQHFRRKSIQE